MFRQRSIHPMLVSVFTVAIFVVGTNSTLAQQPDPGPPGDKVLITEVTAVIDEGPPATTTLTITGRNFSFLNELVVTLGELGEVPIPGVPTDTQIVAVWPAVIPAGDYLVTVSIAAQTGQPLNDEYDLTIGAAPSEPTCPCEGLSAGGITWDNTFTIDICSFETVGVTLIGTGDGQSLETSDVRHDGDPTCKIRNVTVVTSEPLDSYDDAFACRQSLLAIAFETGGC